MLPYRFLTFGYVNAINLIVGNEGFYPLAQGAGFVCNATGFLRILR
jgi:hypothetical protein